MPTDKTVANPLPPLVILSAREEQFLRAAAQADFGAFISGAAFNQLCESMAGSGYVDRFTLKLTDKGKAWLASRDS